MWFIEDSLGWERATGRWGRWVIPDWPRVADSYDGVHLTAAGYLSAAGTAIDVDTDIASVIAGWSPDETYWLTDTVTRSIDTRNWVRDDDGQEPIWVEETR